MRRPAGTGVITKHLILAGELLLLLHVVDLFQIEKTRGFVGLARLVVLAFVIHAFLPRAWKLPFFLLTTLVGIFQLLGPVNGCWLLGLGAGVILISHLPASRARIAVIAGAALVLGALRAGWIPNPVPMVVWPIFGSMFMFRLIIYLYDRRHERSPAPLLQRIAYFFLLPNICFPFFPIIDYAAFRKTYYNDEDYRIYQSGIGYMCLGIAHLLLYRLVYYNAAVPVTEVQNVGSLGRFLVTNYLLYLRVSGQFHLIIGTLKLFGFNLPRTHNFFFLASGFSDFWRRINIYWKDFMTKCFFYPLFKKLEKKGVPAALVVATGSLFLATWLLHSYQWFWLRGGFPLTLHEGLFWGIVGLCVVGNTLYEYRHSRKVRLTPQPKGLWRAIVLSLRVTGMFILMSVLWSLFTASGMTEWRSLWALPAQGWSQGAFWCIVTVVAALGIGTAVQFIRVRRPSVQARPERGLVRAAVPVCVFAALLTVAGHLPKLAGVSKRWVTTIRSVQQSRLNMEDDFRRLMGYYEGLVNVNQCIYPIEARWARPRDWMKIVDARMTQRSRPLVYELRPSIRLRHHGILLQTNQWGMRDKEYEKDKPEGTIRIALLGASEVFGLGVESDQVFEALVERWLNEDGNVPPGARFEVLNFSCPAYFALMRCLVLESKALAFNPDVVLYVAHWNDTDCVAEDIAGILSPEEKLPYPFLESVAERAGLSKSASRPMVRKRLRPYAEEILRGLYGRIVSACRDAHATPICVYVPLVGDQAIQGDWIRQKKETIIQVAKESGFKVIDLSGTYAGCSVDDLRLASWDNHANATAHRLVARRLYPALQEELKDLFPAEARVGVH